MFATVGFGGRFSFLTFDFVGLLFHIVLVNFLLGNPCSWRSTRAMILGDALEFTAVGNLAFQWVNQTFLDQVL